jgi:hypothetical protein
MPLYAKTEEEDGAGITENPQNKGNYKRFKREDAGDALHFIGKGFGLSDFNGDCGDERLS